MKDEANPNPQNARSFLGVKRIHVADHERGILWHDNECAALLGPGTRWFFDPLGKTRVTLHDRRLPWLDGDARDLLVASGKGGNEISSLELADHQRAIALRDGRFAAILGPGLHAWWNDFVKIDVSVVDIRENDGAVDLSVAPSMAVSPDAAAWFETAVVPPETRTAYFLNGKPAGILPPGRHVFWRGPDSREFYNIDTREQSLDINGQELLTQDKLAVRMNAVLTYRVADIEKSLSAAADLRSALYREAQLSLRSAVGLRDLDALLSDRESLAGAMAGELAGKAERYGAEVSSFGVKDIVLPGDVKALVMKAAEARKTSEAATILRREETAAMRHQLNTARLLSDNPNLMRLRELEAVEKLAEGGKLTVVLGDKGLVEKVGGML